MALHVEVSQTLHIDGHIGEGAYDELLLLLFGFDLCNSSKIYIDALTATVDPDGVKEWCRFVTKHLPEKILQYHVSKLADMLLDNEDYRHRISIFPIHYAL